MSEKRTLELVFLGSRNENRYVSPIDYTINLANVLPPKEQYPPSNFPVARLNYTFWFGVFPIFSFYRIRTFRDSRLYASNDQ